MANIRTNWNSGQPIPARDVRGNSEALKELYTQGRAINAKVERNDARYVVKLTARDDTGGVLTFEFEEVQWNTTSNVWETRANGVTHATVGKAVAQGGINSEGQVDDIVTIRPGERIDADGRALWEFVPAPKSIYWAKVTASSSGSADLTLAECDSDGNTITDGRTPSDARVPMERRGIPVDTYGVAIELLPTTAGNPVVTKFLPWDGETTSPKDLVASGATADSATYDIESDSEPVNYQPFRIYDDTGTSGNWYYFYRDIIADASGMITNVSAETRDTLPGDGYNELRKNNVLVDSAASNGVIDFDDQQTPGTNELVVEWTLTGDQDAVAGGANDGLRTQVQGLVDVSSVVGSGGGTNNIVAKLVKIDNTVTTGHYAVLDDDDYSERIVAIHYDGQGSVSEATWGTANSPGAVGTWYIAGDTSPAGGEYDLFSLAGFRVFVDHGDSSKLKVEASSPGTYNYLSVVIIKGPQKSSEDIANGDFAAP